MKQHRRLVPRYLFCTTLRKQGDLKDCLAAGSSQPLGLFCARVERSAAGELVRYVRYRDDKRGRSRYFEDEKELVESDDFIPTRT
jgi:hypothetical protein